MNTSLKPVLSAEDEETDAYILRLAFEESKVPNPLILVNDGEEVVKYLSGAPPYSDRMAYPLPALITLDLKMARMSGFNVLEWLRDHPAFAAIPTVVISSSSEDADINRARRLGAHDYFPKPHRLDDFIAIIHALRDRWLVPHPAAPGSQ